MKEILYIILLNIALGALKFLVIFGNALSNFISFHDNKFLVGYGLDYNGYYRNIPYIGYVEGV